MKLLNFLIIKLTICLLLGILFGYYSSINLEILIVLTVSCVLLFGVIFFKTHRTIIQSSLFGVCTCVLMFLIGALTLQFHTAINHQWHYSKLSKLNGTQNLKFHVFKKLKSSKYHQKYLGEVLTINSEDTKGVVLINADTTQVIAIDTVLYASVEVQTLSKPKNPHQFDYNLYMKHKSVYHQVFLNNKNTLVLPSEKSLYGVANRIRQRINVTLKEYNVSKDNLSILNALFLGQRQDISKETYKSFTSSGAIHILAISGLHIGLLLLLLQFCFKPLIYFKHGKLAVSIIIILLLWTYAFIVGMSASVIRAVTMFSLVTIAIYSDRITNTYNTLVISAFFLLLFHPFYVFDIGFQMSYAAVFAIVGIKPQFDKLWQPKFYITRKFWDVFSVTIAAQLGVLPLSLFYFHQFPGLFFISNLVIIPLLGFLLGIGIVALVFAYFGWIPQMLFDVFNNAISLLLSFVEQISSKEDFLWRQISFNELNLISSYVFIIGLVLFWKSYTYKRLVFFLSSILCIQVSLLANKWHYQKKSFIVFNQYKTTLIAHRNGREFNFMSNSKDEHLSVETYITNEFITSPHKDSLRNVLIFNNKKILVVDEKAIYNTSFKPNIVVLTASPKINLNRLIKVLKPKQIVVDNNNYKSYMERWEKTCLAEDVSFYNIKTNGAFVLK